MIFVFKFENKYCCLNRDAAPSLKVLMVSMVGYLVVRWLYKIDMKTWAAFLVFSAFLEIIRNDDNAFLTVLILIYPCMHCKQNSLTSVTMCRLDFTCINKLAFSEKSTGSKTVLPSQLLIRFSIWDA